ncbi:MAG: RNA polymerase sigma factor [Acidobacteria bacterium]|nr:RNA polymerase sigma factor [Acidobacteriota bacterium]
MEDRQPHLTDEEFDRLVNEQKDRVYSVALSFLRNSYDADEVAQDVFVEVWRSIEGFKGQSKLETWIYRITVHKCLDLIKSRKRKKRSGILVSLFENDRALDLPSATFDHPGIALEHKERALLLFAAIDSLPAKQRLAYTLCDVDGLSYEEIAEVLQTTVSAVESLIFRARKELRERLRRHFKGASSGDENRLG